MILATYLVDLLVYLFHHKTNEQNINSYVKEKRGEQVLKETIRFITLGSLKIEENTTYNNTSFGRITK